MEEQQNKSQKLSKKQQKALEEEKIKKSYSERAYLQRTLDRELKSLESIKFSQKFMLIAFGVFTIIMGATLFVEFKIFWFITTIIFATVFVGSLIWTILYCVKFKPKRMQKISEIRQKLQVYNQAEREKLQKIQQIINKQKQ